MYEERNSRLEEILCGMHSLAIAYSGGIDSSLLLYRAWQVLGNNVAAITVLTPYMPTSDSKDANDFTDRYGIRHYTVPVKIPKKLHNNPQNRCYICKRMIFSNLLAKASELSIETTADGTLFDDSPATRPGMAAAKDMEVSSPLRAAGITKAMVRTLARQEGIPLWNKPTNSCYLTRFPYGTSITQDKIAMVQNAENLMNSYGYRDVRVRYRDGTARIELPYEDWKRFASSIHIEQIKESIRSYGFASPYSVPYQNKH